MTIRWITQQLGTAAASSVRDVADIYIVDVRNLVDKAGNPVEATREKVNEGVESLSLGQRTVICCDYGMSRSNAVATGILACFEKITFDAALRRVQEATGETEIKLQPLSAVREALGMQVKKEQLSHHKSIIVTGGNGFLGKALRASIGDEYRLVTPTSTELDISLGSTQLDLLASEEEVDCIIHLANPRVYTSNIAMGQSLTILRNVIDVCLSRNISLIYPSSWEIYSGYAGILLADESTPALPRGPYGETKYLTELLIEHCRKTEGLRCTLLRSGPVYGVNGDKPKFIYNFIDKAFRSETIMTHQYMNGVPSLDLMYVDDFVSALVSALKSDFMGNLNIGTGILTSTKDIAQMVKAKLKSNSRIEQIAIEANVASIAMDWRQAKDLLNWQPTVVFEDGLERILTKI